MRFVRFYNWSDATNDPPALYRWLQDMVQDSNGVPHSFTVPDPELKGLGAALGTTCSGGQYSHTKNIMMMRQTIPDGYGMLNESQIQRLRSYLRYESEIRDNRWSGLAGEPHNRT